MKKIILLMLIQIIVLSSSVAIIIHEESKQDFIGEHVNLVGQNRYLSELVIHKITESAIDPNHHVEFTAALNQSLENISLLKNGWIVNNKEIPPLAEKYQDDLDKLLSNYMLVEDTASEVYGMALDGIPILQIHVFQESSEHIVEENTMIANFLVNDLNKNYLETINYLVLLKLSFTFLNVIVYIVTGFFIVLIIRKETKLISDYERIKVFEKVAAKLAHELRTSLTVIIGTTQILDRFINHSDEEIKVRWKRLYESLLEMDDKIEELIDCLRSGKSDPTKKDVKDPQL